VHSVFGKINYGGFKTQQLTLGTGTASWWVTETHWPNKLECFPWQALTTKVSCL